jgi:hypothetical protein
LVQDSDNKQSGLYINVNLRWPSRVEDHAAVLSLLSQHPGKSIVARVPLQMVPEVQWAPGTPFADDYNVTVKTWTCAA